MIVKIYFVWMAARLYRRLIKILPGPFLLVDEDHEYIVDQMKKQNI